MIKKAAIFPFIYILLLFFTANYAPAQTLPAGGSGSAQPAPGFVRLQSGLALFQEGRWQEAITELRRAQGEALDRELRAEILFWISLAKISAGEYAASIKDMEDLEILAPNSRRLQDIPYHKGRALYYLGRYDEAILLLKYYADGIGGSRTPAPGSDAAARKSAALYWLGESLYALGQLDYARDIFTIITEEYPQSAKFEASTYRLELIGQKKIEEELLYLLKWSHEESLKAIEEYQRRERSYDQALIAYQKRIAELLRDTPGGGTGYQPSSQSPVQTPVQPMSQMPPQAPLSPQSPLSEQERNSRLRDARTTAVELSSELTELLDKGGRR